MLPILPKYESNTGTQKCDRAAHYSFCQNHHPGRRAELCASEEISS